MAGTVGKEQSILAWWWSSCSHGFKNPTAAHHFLRQSPTASKRQQLYNSQLSLKTCKQKFSILKYILKLKKSA